MRLDLIPFDQWFSLNDEIKKNLNLPEGARVQAFKGAFQALYEAATSISQLIQHKRSFIYIQSGSPYFQSLIPLLVRDGYKAIFCELSDLQKVVSENANELAFVLMAEDHAVTAELYDYTPFESTLASKKIFSIRMAHHSFWRPVELGNYTVRIGSIAPELAVVTSGGRARLSSVVAKDMAWDIEKSLAIISNSHQQFQEDEKKVKSFEGNLESGFCPYFNQGQNRIYDRSVIYHPQYSGEALASFFGEGVGTPNLCVWGGVNVYQTWWKPLPVEEVIRGMLVIDLKKIGSPHFLNDLKQAMNQCQV